MKVIFPREVCENRLWDCLHARMLREWFIAFI